MTVGRQSVQLLTVNLVFSCTGRRAPMCGRSASKGTATWDNIFNAFDPTVGATFDGKAQVSHLGKVRQTGTLFLSPVPNEDGLLPGFGSVTLTAANGDKLTFGYNGLLDPATGLGIGNLTFTGGTGRFADAEGEGAFTANLDFNEGFIGTPMAVTIRGAIDD